MNNNDWYRLLRPPKRLLDLVPEYIAAGPRRR